MKIVIPFPYFREGMGGIYKFCLEFSREAVSRGHEVVIISSLPKNKNVDDVMSGVRIIRVPLHHARLFRRIRDYVLFGRKVSVLIKKEHPDIILGVSLGAYGGVGCDAPLVYRSAATPIIVEQNIWKKLLNDKIVKKSLLKRVFLSFDFFLQKTIERACLRNAKAFFCQSNELYSYFQREYSLSSSLRVCSPCTGVDTKKFYRDFYQRGIVRERLGVRDDEKIIMFSGGLSPIKGAFVLENALSLVFKSIPNAKFLLVGSEQCSFNLGEYNNRILRTGSISLSEIPNFYSASDIFVLPSLVEGFPNTLLEAMSCSLPCICTPLVGMAEYAKNKRDILIVPFYDHLALADAIIFCLKNPAICSSLGKNARKQALKFDWGIVSTKMLSFLESVVESESKIST
ncbi:glycosyltransferase family 4 protein [Candidatus Woesearchaeota archaeon]|nr:glycosyltransferase family 4 protein [Candidatus Woesearchaeota archaeon]